MKNKISLFENSRINKHFLIRILLTLFLLILMCSGFKIALYIIVALLCFIIEIINYHMRKVYIILKELKEK